MHYDTIIRGGMIYDGTGAAPVAADVAVMGDKIAKIGDLSKDTAQRVLDACGKAVTPGFIDCHTHSDSTIWANPLCQSSVRQGVTTQVVGNCGLMRPTVAKEHFDPAGDGITCLYDLGGTECPKGAMAAVLDKMDAMGASMNTAWMVGHNALRIFAHLDTPDCSPEQFDVMEDLLREGMEAGFIGFSTGLEFVPGNVSKPEEVQKLAAIAAQYGGIYCSHMRDEGNYILQAVDEFLDVIRKTHMRGSISHLNVKYDNGVPNEYLFVCMDKLRQARKEGLAVYTDMLPTCFASGNADALLPPWLYESGWERAKEILADPEGREKVKQDFSRYWRYLAAGQWDRLLYVKPPYLPKIHTTPFKDLVAQSGKDPFDCFLDIVQQAPDLDAMRRFEIQGIAFDEQTMVDTVVKDPIYLWMTDEATTLEEGAVAEVTANLQYYMSMFWFFIRYVRELKALPLEQALTKVTSIPAAHFGLQGRGVLKEGNFADINVFDLEALRINATFSQPNRYCSGMDYVIVNGTIVLEHDEHTLARAGRVLRHGK
ncbi:MAG: amidohydrolase family protein [Oscillospiraceae bacterium]|nr:amidohydrolase family protein [Oscillospiraceae bacterium]